MKILGKSMRQSDVLLVGFDGYIGSNCTLENVKGIDIKSGNDFLEFPIQNGFRTIIFLAAAKADVTQTVDDYLYNEKLYDRLDEWIKEYPNMHIIFASSAAVYGETTRPSLESDYLAPLGLYGRSKLAGEFRIREYKRHTILRFGNVYGRLRGQRGHGVTELFMDGAKQIYGNGNQVRDFVPIRMIWKAIECAVNYPMLWRGVTNVGTKESTTINDWFKKWGKGEPEYVEARPMDIYFSTLDNTKMLERLKQCR